MDKHNEDDSSKFLRHFPVDGDLTLQILKGHLLVEELIRELFIMQLPNSNVLKGDGGTSFDCHQTICLVEAMILHSQKMPWIWLAAKKLNNIRNDLSHNLNPKGIKNKVKDLTSFVKKKSPELKVIATQEGFPEGEELLMVIIAMCSCLSSLKPVLADYLINAHNLA